MQKSEIIQKTEKLKEMGQAYIAAMDEFLPFILSEKEEIKEMKQKINDFKNGIIFMPLMIALTTAICSKEIITKDDNSANC